MTGKAQRVVQPMMKKTGCLDVLIEHLLLKSRCVLCGQIIAGLGAPHSVAEIPNVASLCRDIHVRPNHCAGLNTAALSFARSFV
jgi:hypothetical protein